jgi:integrase
MRPGDALDDPGPLAGYGAEQQSKLKAAYGRWLGFLDENRVDWRASRGTEHFTRESVTAFVGRLNAVLAPCSVRAYVTDLLTVARAFAPHQQFDALRGATRHIWRTAKPVTDKRGRLVPARDLYDLGFDLMGSAAACSTLLAAAAAYRDGLMIGLLAARPVRLANLTSIRIGEHLDRHGDLFWLTFPAREVKTRRTLEFPLPQALTPAMTRYLETYRPFLTRQHGRWRDEPGDRLWISADGGPLGHWRIRQRICQCTRKRFGEPVNPHLFRDAAATSIAIEDPEHVGIVLAILGHSTMRTSETYYNQAATIDAVRQYQDVVSAFR